MQDDGHGATRQDPPLTGVVTIVCVVLALGVAVLGGVRALRDQRTEQLDLAAAAVTELAVLVYVVVRVVDLIGGHHPPNLAILLVYLAAQLLVLPVTAALSWAEPSKWGSITLAAGALVTCVLFARIDQLWTPHG